MEGSLMSFPGNSQPDLNLEQQRKRAKDLRRGHRDRNLEAAVRVARHLPRARNQSAEEVLRSTLTLSEAQFVVAREVGFSSWPKLKHHIEESTLSGADLRELMINAAFAGDHDAVRAMLARDPAPARGSIHVAAAVADVQAVLALLNADPPLAGSRSGKRNWPPLLYLCCSRYRRAEQGAAAARLRIAKRLIELGADVNAAGLELGYTAPCVNQMFDEHEWRPIDGAAGPPGSAALLRPLVVARAHLYQTPATRSPAVRDGRIAQRE